MRGTPTADELDRITALEDDVRRLKLRAWGQDPLPPVVWAVAGPDQFLATDADAAAGLKYTATGATEWGIPVDGPAAHPQLGSGVVPVLGDSGDWGHDVLNDPSETHPTNLVVPEPGFYAFGMNVNYLEPVDGSDAWISEAGVYWFDLYVYTVTGPNDPNGAGAIKSQHNGSRCLNEDGTITNRGFMKGGATGFQQLFAGDKIGSWIRSQGPTTVNELRLGRVAGGTAIPLLWAFKVPGS